MRNLISKITAVLLLPILVSSCMTAYDANGNPIQAVDSRAVAAGVAAAAAIAYAVGRNSRGCYGGGGYYRPCY